jgi:SAM-dependent methyltransferase
VSQNDPDIVRREYADERGFAARRALWAKRSGLQPPEVALREILAVDPRRVLDAGCGQGEFGAELAAVGVNVVGLDQSERMVDLARERGIEAIVGDVQALPFADGEFDAVAANFMLYHVPDVHRALGELARVLRPGGRLVAATNGVKQLVELWDLVGRDLSDRWQLFMRETGADFLRPHFAHVCMIPLDGTIDLTADEMRHYVAHSVAHRSAALRVPDFAGTRTVTTSAAVFVAEVPGTAETAK